MARIMVVAGGAWQCPITKLAKEKGHFVISTNLYEDSPAFKYADVGVIADVLDKEKNLEIAKQYQPDAVLTDQSDIAVPTVAYIAEQLGLKGIGSDMAAHFTNKYMMRQAAEKAGVASPHFKKCGDPESAKTFLRDYGKSVIKPLDSQSSRGVHIVETERDIEECFADCVQYSHSEHAILIEEYIGGVEFTVDGLCTADGYIVTAISQKEHFTHNPSIASRLLFSQENENFDYSELRQVNTSLVEHMGLPFGQTHAEYKFDKGQYYLIEIAARGGGTKISSDIVPLVSGIQNNEIYINTLLGIQERVEKRPAHPYAVLGFFSFPEGKVTAINGVEEAKLLPGVHDLKLEFSVGDRVSLASDDRSRCGFYIVYGNSENELIDNENRLKRTIKVSMI